MRCVEGKNTYCSPFFLSFFLLSFSSPTSTFFPQKCKKEQSCKLVDQARGANVFLLSAHLFSHARMHTETTHSPQHTQTCAHTHTRVGTHTHTHTPTQTHAHILALHMHVINHSLIQPQTAIKAGVRDQLEAVWLMSGGNHG